MYHKSNLPLRPAYVINTYQHSRPLNPDDTIRGSWRRRETGLRAEGDGAPGGAFAGTEHAWPAKKKKHQNTTAAGANTTDAGIPSNKRRASNHKRAVFYEKKEKLEGSGNLGVPLLPAATRWPLFGQQARTFHRVKSSAAGQLLTRPCGEPKKKAKRKSTFLRLGGHLCSPRPCYLSRSELNSLPSVSEVCSGTQAS